MAKYTFFTQAAKDGSIADATSEELINCYAEQAAGNARTMLTIRSVLGEASFATLTTVLPQAAALSAGDIFVVANGTLSKISEAGAVTDIGAVSVGDTSISGNGIYTAVAANGTYYVYDGATLTTPGSGRIASVGSVAFMDQYTILTEKDGAEFEWTAVADPTTRNALYFATAEGRNDNLLRAVVDRSQLYLFGESSIEAWYNTGAAGASAFARLAGGVIDQGLKGYGLVTRFDAGVFFIGDDNVAYLLSGGALTPISTPAVQTDLAEATPSRCGYYEDRGHKFCVIRFDDAPAWVYDITTQLWHRRASGVDHDAWQTVDIVGAWGGWYALNNASGVYTMTRNNTDVAGALRRTMRGKPIYMDGRKFSVAEWEMLCRVGSTSLGRDAQVMFRGSWDSGRTWGAEQTASLGTLGDYNQRAIFRTLGRGVQFTPEFSITDAADITMFSDANVRLT